MDKLDKIITESITNLLNETMQNNSQGLQYCQNMYKACENIIGAAQKQDRQTVIEQSNYIYQSWTNNRDVQNCCESINENANSGNFENIVNDVNKIVKVINEYYKKYMKSYYDNSHTFYKNLQNKGEDITNRVMNNWFGFRIHTHNYSPDDYDTENSQYKYFNRNGQTKQ